MAFSHSEHRGDMGGGNDQACDIKFRQTSDHGHYRLRHRTAASFNQQVLARPLPFLPIRVGNTLHP